MSIFTKRVQPAKMMLSEASSPFFKEWLDNVKIQMYTKFEPKIPCCSRVISIFTKRARPAKMMSFENVDGRTPDASIYYKLTFEPTAQVS